MKASRIHHSQGSHLTRAGFTLMRGAGAPSFRSHVYFTQTNKAMINPGVRSWSDQWTGIQISGLNSWKSWGQSTKTECPSITNYKQTNKHNRHTSFQKKETKPRSNKCRKHSSCHFSCVFMSHWGVTRLLSSTWVNWKHSSPMWTKRTYVADETASRQTQLLLLLFVTISEWSVQEWQCSGGMCMTGPNPRKLTRSLPVTLPCSLVLDLCLFFKTSPLRSLDQWKAPHRTVQPPLP